MIRPKSVWGLQDKELKQPLGAFLLNNTKIRRYIWQPNLLMLTFMKTFPNISANMIFDKTKVDMFETNILIIILSVLNSTLRGIFRKMRIYNVKEIPILKSLISQ